ncbi:unnamed protein product [Fraxinus pennsylvanica]|uniref:Uncharacterized protein n=1 Tax=Fraxinus pennsylvanica TaxID=56036 RepID=A0AAD2E4C8_9LAMI|nr:unnamed protein product [Fraxinus pennsylvanica]
MDEGIKHLISARRDVLGGRCCWWSLVTLIELLSLQAAAAVLKVFNAILEKSLSDPQSDIPGYLGSRRRLGSCGRIVRRQFNGIGGSVTGEENGHLNAVSLPFDRDQCSIAMSLPMSVEEASIAPSPLPVAAIQKL